MSLFDFRIKNGILVKYSGKDENVVIPSKVHTIGESAFENNNRIKSVVIPNGVTTIDSKAFKMAKNLERIVLPDGLKVIKDQAFMCCYALKEVKFPNSLNKICESGFQGCTALKEIEFPDNGMRIGRDAFNHCDSLEKVIIPDSIDLAYWTFFHCENVRLAVSRYKAEWLFGFKSTIPVVTMEEYGKTQSKNETVSGELHLKYRTRADLPLADKKYIFLHYAEQDSELAKQIAHQILYFENGINYAIWISENPKAVFLPENQTEISRMSVFMPIITANYLEMARSFGTNFDGRCNFSLETLNSEVTAVIPLFMGLEQMSEFNSLFGDLQGIDSSNSQLQMNLEAHIENLLGDSQLNEKIIQDGFSGNYFLSYRKKDRKNALEIMRGVHNTAEGFGAAIWFDDFLVPGENFNSQIDDSIMNSDAVILSVTPSLLEEGNYVKEKEYPLAAATKDIVPIEAAATDRERLMADYPGLEPCIHIKDETALNNRLRKIAIGGKEKQYGPHELYLIARAFLSGFRVERDIQRGMKLLEESADGNDPDACFYMGFLYLSGRGVQRNLDITAKWYQKAYGIYKGNKDYAAINRLLFGTDGLVLILQSRGRTDDAIALCKEFIAILNTAEPSCVDVEEIKLWKARALSEASDIHFITRLTADKAQYALELANEMVRLLEDYHGNAYDEAQSLLGTAYANFAKVHRAYGQTDLARSFYEKAIDAFNDLKVPDKDPTQEYRKIYSGILIEYGLLRRELAIQESFSHPSRSIELMQPAKSAFSEAYIIKQLLAEQMPTIYNREGLATALYNLALVSENKKDSQDYLQRAQIIVSELQKETGDGSFDDFEKDISSLMKKRRLF